MATDIFWRSGAAAPKSDPFSGLKPDKGGRLQDILKQYYLPELGRSRGQRSAMEQAFLGTLDPNAGVDFVTQGAERIASDVLRPGGPITEAIRGARGASISKGWGTTGGDLSRQEANIVSEGLRSSIGSYVGQALPGLYESAASRTALGYQLTEQQVQDLLQSLYTGQAGAESLNLASKQPGLFGSEGILGISGVPIL